MFFPDEFPVAFNFASMRPYLSEKALDYHYNKHFAGYIDNLNKLIKDTDYEHLYLYEIIKKSAQNNDVKIFNNAAQTYNHDFFFKNLKSPDKKMDVPSVIANAFGGADNFKSEFKNAAMSVFGSGWTWLVKRGDKFEIISTKNADCPMTMGDDVMPIMVIDVWEHAYYLDYQNRRAEYIDMIMDNLIDWQKIEKKL